MKLCEVFPCHSVHNTINQFNNHYFIEIARFIPWSRIYFYHYELNCVILFVNCQLLHKVNKCYDTLFCRNCTLCYSTLTVYVRKLCEKLNCHCNLDLCKQI